MSDPVRGKTIRWSYDDGPVAGKTFEHTFTDEGTVSWREPGTTSGAEPSVPYQAVWITRPRWTCAPVMRPDSPGASSGSGTETSVATLIREGRRGSVTPP